MLNLSTHLDRSAAVFATRLAVDDGRTRMTYAELAEASRRVAAGLHGLGVRRGDAVALACPNRAEFVIAYYAILRLGAVVVPLNILLKSEELRFHLEDARAVVFLCFDGDAALPLGEHGARAWQAAGGAASRFVGFGEAPAWSEAPRLADWLARPMPAPPCAATDETDVAVVLYTSGTTGRPKGAMLTHSNLALNAAYSALMQKADSRDVHLVALPLFHSFGQTLQMNAAVLVGAALRLMPRFDAAAALACIEDAGVTIFAGVPTMYAALLDASDAASAHPWRLGISGGAALPVPVLHGIEKRFGITMLEGYGLSETSPLACFSFPDTARLPGCVGYALHGTELEVVDPQGRRVPDGACGEVRVRGHHVMAGYLGQPAATAEVLDDDGWLATGDIGRIVAGGALQLVDRAKDVIVRGGYKVYPREVEELLLTHPAVAQAAVVGIAHPTLGEDVKAVVVLRAGMRCEADALIDWARDRIAAFKYPRVIAFADSLPRNATGKVLRRALREAPLAA